MAKAEYMRWYRSVNPDFVERQNAQAYERYWSDAKFRQERRILNAQRKAAVWAFARAARKDLRSFMALDPRIANHIKRCINIESASDAVVARFYRQLKKELRNGNAKDW